MTWPACVVPLPADSFISVAEYLAEGDANQPAHEARRRVERRRLKAGRAAAHPGICGPCLRAVRFQGCAPGAGWAAEQRCDCEDTLGAGARILLHAALAEGVLRPWSRVLWLGASPPLHRRVRALAGSAVVVPDPHPEALRRAAGQHADLIVAADVLDRVAGVAAFLAVMRAMAAPSATLLAGFPFHPGAPASLYARPAAAGGRRAVPAHAIGWDILHRAAEAGWEDARMLRVWCRELGYLGPANFLLRATAG